MKRIAVIEGHPDSSGTHLNHALASAYADGAIQAGHHVDRIAVATLDFPILRSAQDWKEGRPPEAILVAQRTIASADHLVLFYPLWMGDMPALFKGFLEQVFRPTMPATAGIAAEFPKVLRGKSARIVVTMGMPGHFYRWYYGAHSLKSLERNILRFAGVSRVRSTLFGMVEAVDRPEKRGWFEKMRALGAKAS